MAATAAGSRPWAALRDEGRLGEGMRDGHDPPPDRRRLDHAIRCSSAARGRACSARDRAGNGVTATGRWP